MNDWFPVTLASFTFLLLGWVMVVASKRCDSVRRNHILSCLACFFFGGSLGSVLVRWIVELLTK